MTTYRATIRFLLPQDGPLTVETSYAQRDEVQSLFQELCPFALSSPISGMLSDLTEIDACARMLAQSHWPVSEEVRISHAKQIGEAVIRLRDAIERIECAAHLREHQVLPIASHPTCNFTSNQKEAVHAND